MFQEQRLHQLVQLLEEKHELYAKDMVRYFNVSRDTIRRDFERLSREGKAKRTHGGIISNSQTNNIASFNERLETFTQQKEAIAKRALNFIGEQGTYFFDASTITLTLAKLLSIPVTIYSHSLDNAIMLSTKEFVTFHLLGGKFFNKNRFYYSLNESELVNTIQFDGAFIGAAGLKNGIVSFDDPEDARVKKLVLKNAACKILLAEQNKFDIAATHTIGQLSAFDYLITDKKLDLAISQQKLTILYE